MIGNKRIVLDVVNNTGVYYLFMIQETQLYCI